MKNNRCRVLTNNASLLTICKPNKTLAMATMRSTKSSSRACWLALVLPEVVVTAVAALGFFEPSFEYKWCCQDIESDGSILSGSVNCVLAKSTISCSATFYDHSSKILLVVCFYLFLDDKIDTFKKRSLQCCTNSCSRPGKRLSPTGKRRLRQATISDAAISFPLSRLRSRDFFFFCKPHNRLKLRIWIRFDENVQSFRELRLVLHPSLRLLSYWLMSAWWVSYCRFRWQRWSSALPFRSTRQVRGR